MILSNYKYIFYLILFREIRNSKFHPINFSRQRLLKCPRIFKLKIGANSRSGSLTMTGTSRWVGTIIESSSLTAPVFIQISISIVERTRKTSTRYKRVFTKHFVPYTRNDPTMIDALMIQISSLLSSLRNLQILIFSPFSIKNSPYIYSKFI